MVSGFTSMTSAVAYPPRFFQRFNLRRVGTQNFFGGSINRNSSREFPSLVVDPDSGEMVADFLVCGQRAVFIGNSKDGHRSPPRGYWLRSRQTLRSHQNLHEKFENLHMALGFLQRSLPKYKARVRAKETRACVGSRAAVLSHAPTIPSCPANFRGSAATRDARACERLRAPSAFHSREFPLRRSSRALPRAPCSTPNACAAPHQRPTLARLRRAAAPRQTVFHFRERRVVRSSISIKLDTSSAPLSRPVEVIASRIGAREITALKFPLVPNTHPRS